MRTSKLRRGQKTRGNNPALQSNSLSLPDHCCFTSPTQARHAPRVITGRPTPFSSPRLMRPLTSPTEPTCRATETTPTAAGMPGAIWTSSPRSHLMRYLSNPASRTATWKVWTPRRQIRGLRRNSLRGLARHNKPGKTHRFPRCRPKTEKQSAALPMRRPAIRARRASPR
jgi:hypothetical protein